MKHTCRTCAYGKDQIGCYVRASLHDEECWRLHPRYIIIPVVGAVYGGAKSFSETVLTDKGSSFKQVVMVEFPRKGIFSIGFITSHDLEEVQARTEQLVTCVFVPTTPNPTTGFLVLVPKNEVVMMDMTVDEAFKMLLTLGVVVPTWKNKPVDGRLAPPQGGP